MAKIKFGAVVTDMRNKVGSQVFSRNRYGPYTRSFKTTLSSNTASQVTVRNRLGSFAAAWKVLTQDERDSWNSAVDNFRHSDIFGDIVSPSGFDLYVKLNCNLDQIGNSPLTIPPVPLQLPTIQNFLIAAESTTPQVLITFDGSAISSDYSLVVMATACISPGKRYVKNLLRQIAVIAPSVGVPYDITTAYLAKFSSILSTQRISMSIITVSKISGQKSIPFYATCIVGGVAGLDFNQALDTGIPLT